MPVLTHSFSVPTPHKHSLPYFLPIFTCEVGILNAPSFMKLSHKSHPYMYPHNFSKCSLSYMPVCTSKPGDPGGNMQTSYQWAEMSTNIHVCYLIVWDSAKSRGKNNFFLAWRIYFKYLGTWYMAFLTWAPKMLRVGRNKVGSFGKLVSSLLFQVFKHRLGNH